MSLAHEFRTIFLPVLPSELVSALLCVLVAGVYVHSGFAALSLLAVVLVVFQFLLRELLRSRERAERLASVQLGVLTAMIETLALRDRMTARHSAAVARYASELAASMGLSDEEVDLVHTAGLLHDIGKFAFPDSILLAEPRLQDEQWEIVKRHPEDGARIVRRVDGYGAVADIILNHHERWDGGGYPRGLAAAEIPLAARLISVADTYDVLTARDSYRQPISSDGRRRRAAARGGHAARPGRRRRVRGPAEREGHRVPPRRRRRVRGRAGVRRAGARLRPGRARFKARSRSGSDRARRLRRAWASSTRHHEYFRVTSRRASGLTNCGWVGRLGCRPPRARSRRFVDFPPIEGKIDELVSLHGS